MEKHPGGRPRTLPTQVIRVPSCLVPAVEKLVEAFKAEPTNIELLVEAFREVALTFVEKNKDRDLNQ